MCSITGFGQDGPYREHPAYDIIVQALSGGMSITGEVGGKPVRSGIPLGDLAAGMYGVVGVLAAVLEAQQTGIGRHVDVAMLDCQVAMLSYQAAYHLVSGEVPGPQGRGHLSIPTYRAYETSDGSEIVVAANTEKMWRDMCKALDLVDLASDERFRQNGDRLANRNELDRILETRFLGLTKEQALDVLMSHSVPCAPINNLDAALRDPQVMHRNMVVGLRDAENDAVKVVGNPVKISGYDSTLHSYPPCLGKDTRELLEQLLGLGMKEIDELVNARVVACPEYSNMETTQTCGQNL